jgi:hypothetical protein
MDAPAEGDRWQLAAVRGQTVTATGCDEAMAGPRRTGAGRYPDAARALVAALTLPSGISNVCRGGASRALGQGRVAA